MDALSHPPSQPHHQYRLDALAMLAEALENAVTDDCFAASIQTFVQAFGYATAATLRLPTTPFGRPNIFNLGRVRSAFWETLLDQQAVPFADLLAYHATAARPFRWNASSRPTEGSFEWKAAAERAASLHAVGRIYILPTLSQRHHVDGVALTGDLTVGESTDERLLPLGLQAAYLQFRLRHADVRPSNLPLTARETEISYWIAEGKSDWEIGKILKISAKTVNYHVENIKRKLGVATRMQAIVALYTEA